MLMRAAVYLRISEDRTGEQLGVTRQRQDCEQLCRSKGWTPVEYVDNDISATSGKPRPSYERMLADIRDSSIGAVVGSCEQSAVCAVAPSDHNRSKTARMQRIRRLSRRMLNAAFAHARSTAAPV